MKQLEIIFAIGPDKFLKLCDKIWTEYDQTYNIVGYKKVNNDFDVNIVLANGEKKEIRV